MSEECYDMAEGILVIGEVAEGKLSSTTAELLGAARRLGAGTVSCALLGPDAAGAAQSAVAFGADKVYVVDDVNLTSYTTDGYVQAARKVIEQAAPAAVFLGQTDLGRDLAPALAASLGVGVAMDAIELGWNGKLTITRPCYGGNARAVNSFTGTPAIATVRPKSQEALEPDASRQGEIVNVAGAVDPSAIRTKVVSRTQAKEEGIRLEDAEVVVAGGRGLGGPENFAGVEELARLLGGAVGVTRAVADLGWRPVSEQVGLTGKVVSPTLYIAIGVSGASQHMAGCSGAKNIVAINKDPDANIFKAARFGIVADFKQVLPPLIEAVRKAKAEG